MPLGTDRLTRALVSSYRLFAICWWQTWEIHDWKAKCCPTHPFLCKGPVASICISPAGTCMCGFASEHHSLPGGGVGHLGGFGIQLECQRKAIALKKNSSVWRILPLSNLPSLLVGYIYSLQALYQSPWWWDPRPSQVWGARQDWHGL